MKEISDMGAQIISISNDGRLQTKHLQKNITSIFHY